MQGDDRTLDGRQQAKDHDKRQRQRDGEMRPGRRVEPVFKRERKSDHYVARDDDDEVGGQVVGAMVKKLLAANRAGIVGLEKAFE